MQALRTRGENALIDNPPAPFRPTHGHTVLINIRSRAEAHVLAIQGRKSADRQVLSAGLTGSRFQSIAERCVRGDALTATQRSAAGLRAPRG
jgi:hypothetical protein